MKILERLNPHVAKVNPYQPGRPIEEVARELGLDPSTIIKLASNESALGVSPKAQAALVAAVPQMHLYPDAGAFELRHKLAKKQGVKTEELIFGAGSNEILVFLAQALLRPGTSVVASAYAFVIYKILATMQGAEFIEVPAKGLSHDLDAMAAAIRPDTSVVFLCNPNNPTGTLLERAAVDRFMEKVPEDCLVVFDEAYAEICLGDMPDSFRFVRQGRACLVLRTFSKAYGLAGLRIGWGYGPAALIQALEKPRQPFNVTLAAQIAATAALDDDDFLVRSRANYREARDILEAGFTELGLPFERSYANFMLFKAGDAAKVNDGLLREGVIVRPVAPYRLPEWLRVSFGTPAECRRFVASLKKVLGR